MSTPYYEQDGITIYHADCRDILPTLEAGSVDLVCTDPPYGIASVWKGGFSVKHGWGRAGLQSECRNAWDGQPPDAATLEVVLSKGRDAVIWGGNYFPLPPSRGWLVWNKPERNFSLAEAELAWTTRDAVIRVKDLPRSEYDREHPTQKPLILMRWCLEFFPEAQSILDPFMGSGTTLRAAKDLGRRAIGIEISEAYCEIAAKRLQQDCLPLGLEPVKQRENGRQLPMLGTVAAATEGDKVGVEMGILDPLVVSDRE
jgi:site-specific DNA-methyltransferase (adenine-specific)